MEQPNFNPTSSSNPKKNILLWFLVVFAALAVVFFSVSYVRKFVEKNKAAKQNQQAESNLPKQEADSESVIPPKNIYYMTATVTEKRENELAVNGMIPETAFSGREEPRLVTKDEKTQVVKILTTRNYQAVNFSDIQKGDKIVVRTSDDFKNNESVLALTVSVYPAAK
jgi:hypothetical protein